MTRAGALVFLLAQRGKNRPGGSGSKSPRGTVYLDSFAYNDTRPEAALTEIITVLPSPCGGRRYWWRDSWRDRSRKS